MMLGTAMASGTPYNRDECTSEKRDPCASPPCKRLKQATAPVECIILEDSSDANTAPLTNQTSTNKLNDALQSQENNHKPVPTSKENVQQCIETNNSDISLMETETVLEDSDKSQPRTDPPQPALGMLPDTKSDAQICNSVNGVLFSSSKNVVSNDKNGEISSNPVANSQPLSNVVKNGLSPSPTKTTKESGTLLSFFQPVTPGSRNINEEHFKTPSKNDDHGKAPSDCVSNIVGSPCTPVNPMKTGEDSTVVENGITPSPGPPASNTDTKATTPKRKTPGRKKLSVEEKLKREEQLRKQKEAVEQERLAKKKEKERLKEEREKAKMEAKQKKEQEKLEQLEQKKQREKERNEKKEQEEKEKKERLEKKEEERRKREEEKKRKEDEKNLKNEEKRKKEEGEMLKKEKAKSSFASFFIKKDVTAPSKPKEQVPKEAKFRPFELKPFMKLARIPHRKPLTDDDKENLSKCLIESTTICLRQTKEELLVLGKLAREIKLEESKATLCCETVKDNDKDEIMIIDDNLSSELETPETSTSKKEVTKVKAKLLQFHENYRPAYFGSWRKKSKNVGPRRPFMKDEEILNYDVDSDEEWEEEEPGESLSNSEGEDEEDGCGNDDDEEQDGFFVPHGYLSDDEGDGNDAMEQDGDGNENVSQGNTEDKIQRHLAKQKTWEAELKRQCKPMKPIAIGCIWDDEIPSILKQLQACLLTDESIDPTYTKKEHQEPVVSSSSNTSTTMPVPEEAMPFLIKMIHGNDIGLQKFIRLFRKRWTLETKKEGVSEENWESHCTISKRQVERKVTGIAKKELRPSIPKPRWYVHSNILASYKLEDIALPVNGFVTTNPKEKSLSPVPPQTKSPIITSFTDVRDSLVKVNGTVVKETKSENMDVNSMDTTPPVRLE